MRFSHRSFVLNVFLFIVEYPQTLEILCFVINRFHVFMGLILQQLACFSLMKTKMFRLGFSIYHNLIIGISQKVFGHLDLILGN